MDVKRILRRSFLSIFKRNSLRETIVCSRAVLLIANPYGVAIHDHSGPIHGNTGPFSEHESHESNESYQYPFVSIRVIRVRFSCQTSYAKVFSTLPHPTGSYRILPHPTVFYRFLPIGVPFSALRAEKEQITSGK